MGMDVCRYIEVYTPDYDGYIYNKDDIKHLGYFMVGDVFLVYNTEGPHYYRISDIVNSKFVYEPIKEPTDMNEALKFTADLDIVWRVENYDELPVENIVLKEGMLYKYYNNGVSYLKYTNGQWVNVDECPHSWKQIKWNADNYISSGDTYFVSEYIHDGWSTKGTLSGRGLPKDITNDVKSSIYDTSFSHTYARLSEIEQCVIEAQEKFKNEIRNALADNKLDNIADKLTEVLGLLKNETVVSNESEDEDYDEFEDTFDECLGLVNSCNWEYDVVKFVIEDIHGEYVPDENVRVIYTFNN